TQRSALDEHGRGAVAGDLPDLPGRGVRLLTANAGLSRVDGAVVGHLDVVEPGGAVDTNLAGGGAGLHVELPNDRHARLRRARSAITVRHVEHAVGDVAAVGLVQDERRRKVVALVARVLDAD